ncbi:hypothetical protein [Rhizobium grahamii]|uniref:Uncharacterized protein n=1 Tax=Rhizobium grahamii TaxID=1120045 RepID=A0A370KG62_9HYPH|nr:hypothetical protein [Rhizobium grahamii]RDJ03269.1 hypothetical protein B5K06_30185 [Rhizobium grahamii]
MTMTAGTTLVNRSTRQYHVVDVSTVKELVPRASAGSCGKPFPAILRKLAASNGSSNVQTGQSLAHALI